MKINLLRFVTLLLLQSFFVNAQPQTNRVLKLFPEGTVLYGDIPYNGDTLKKHLLDIYLPANAPKNLPLVVFIHGGGWIGNDKTADIGYMGNTVSALINNGIAIASIDYRWATQATFPAQIQDCNRAVSFLYDNAEKYGLDKNRIALMGFSAGGHLASLLGLAHNNKVPDFYMSRQVAKFKIKAVVDFYGPAELILFPGADDAKSPEGLLIGAAPLARPDLAKAASPVTYVDKNDPPFLLIHGEKDNLVSSRHSQLLSAWLTTNGVPNELIIVKGAPHFGKMYDVEEIRTKVINFLKAELK